MRSESSDGGLGSVEGEEEVLSLELQQSAAHLLEFLGFCISLEFMLFLWFMYDVRLI